MNVEFVNPILGALIEVLTTMAGIRAERGPLTIKRDKESLGDVTGMIELKGKQAQGSLAISFTEPAILAIFHNMLGEVRLKLDPEVADLVGEITNMTTGGAKKVFGEKGYDFAMAVPAVISGRHHQVDHHIDAPTVLVPFHTDAGDFYVEVCFAA